MKKETFKYLGAVEIFIYTEKKDILLIHRSKDKQVLPGYYNGLGGKMDMKNIMETPLDACYRELYEESGLEKSDIKDLRLKGVLTVFDKFGEWLVFEFTGRLADTTPKDKILNASHDEGKLEWINIADIEKIKLVPDLCNGRLKDLIFGDQFSFLSSKFNENDKMVESQVTKIKN